MKRAVAQRAGWSAAEVRLERDGGNGSGCGRLGKALVEHGDGYRDRKLPPPA